MEYIFLRILQNLRAVGAIWLYALMLLLAYNFPILRLSEMQSVSFAFPAVCSYLQNCNFR